MSSDQATSIKPRNLSPIPSLTITIVQSKSDEYEDFIMCTSLRVQTKDCFDCTEKGI